MTDASGGLVGVADYLPFGGIWAGDLGENLRFPGQHHDRETGLYYNWHRYYDPAIGRYIEVDPPVLLDAAHVGRTYRQLAEEAVFRFVRGIVPRGLNQPFGYAGNNPIGNMDRLGLSSECVVTCACFGIICSCFKNDEGRISFVGFFTVLAVRGCVVLCAYPCDQFPPPSPEQCRG